jgi:hypothetical protein
MTPVEKVPDYIVIIRCIHCRGKEQQKALAELKVRGLWLTEEQKAMSLGYFS